MIIWDEKKNEKLRLEEMMHVLTLKISEIQQEESTIEEILNEIVQNYVGQLSAEAKDTFKRLEDHVLQLKKGTGFFRVSPVTG